MGKKEKIIVLVMCGIMAAVLIFTAMSSVADNIWSPVATQQDEVKEDDKATATDEEKAAHNQEVTITFADGTMTTRLIENCNCGETTVLKNTSSTKEAALQFIDIIQCKDVQFKIGDVEEPILKDELVKRINEYAFAG